MNPDQKDNAGYTPLHEACSRGHLEIARLLLQYGANHSETALSGIRPLHEAIENGHVEMVRLLLSFGADPCLATYSGQLPISMAEDKEMEDFLKEYLIDIDHKNGVKHCWYTDGSFKIEGNINVNEFNKPILFSFQL
jgi:ankyrin repeat protein